MHPFITEHPFITGAPEHDHKASQGFVLFISHFCLIFEHLPENGGNIECAECPGIDHVSGANFVAIFKDHASPKD